MRDLIKNKLYFEEIIFNSRKSIERLNNSLKTGQVHIDRVNSVKFSIVQYNISIIFCKYSSGYKVEDLIPDLINSIHLTFECWDNSRKIKYESEMLDQYSLGSYDLILCMLSLSYLLNLPDYEFSKLVYILDRDKVKDQLYEFIIKHKLRNREVIHGESYRVFFGIPQVYSKLRKAIIETNKKTGAKLLYEFITKDWYSNHKESSWYNSHKDKYNTYLGYWSFETAAIVKILGIDDSSFINCQYYPKDLVHD